MKKDYVKPILNVETLEIENVMIAPMSQAVDPSISDASIY